MRARQLKPGYFKNEDLARCTLGARMLFAGLWCLADRRGRLEDRPLRIKAELFPYDGIDIDQLLAELAAIVDDDGSPAFLIRYQASGRRYIQVLNFERHQNPHMREPESTIPAPGEHSASTAPAPGEHRTGPAPSGNPLPDTGNPIPDTGARDDGPAQGAEPPPPADDQVDVVSLEGEADPGAGDPGEQFDDTGAPLTRDAALRPPDLVCWVPLKRDDLHVGVTRARITALAREFPLVDVEREFLRPGGIRAWNDEAARGERKAPGRRGFWSHVHQWLDKEQKREARALKARVARPGIVPGFKCDCGKPKRDGAASCPECAELYAAYMRDSMARERRPEVTT